MTAPDYPGFAKVWSDDFNGPSGSPPNRGNWTIETPAQNYNNETQRYTNLTQNAFLNGQGQLCIAPTKTAQGTWTSARMHGNQSFQCDPGHRMIFEARIRVGQNNPAQQQGIWPAFWTLGDSINHGVPWPTCCEWDIMELGNGSSTNLGTLHQTGVNGQHQQTSQPVNFSHADFHTWSLEVDLTNNGDYNSQTLAWKLDGNTWFTCHGNGSGAAERACWDRCARTAFFPILNVAVGGDFVGLPSAQTLGGVESGLTVEYVAIYKSTG